MKKTLSKILMLSTLFFGAKTAGDQLLPVVANSPGAQQSYWKTDISISNPYAENSEAKLRFFKTGVSGNPIEQQIFLEPNQTITLENPLQEMGIEKATGAMEVQSSEKLAITARTYNQMGDEELGQGIKGFLDFEMLKKGEKATFCSPKNNSEYRFNFGVYSKQQSRIKFDVYSDGNLVHSMVRDFSPQLHIQQDAKTFFNKEIDKNSGIIAEMLEGEAFIYGSTVQNASGDGSFEEMNRIEERKPEIPQEEDRFFFYDEMFNGKKIKDIIRENAEAISKILVHGYYYDITDSGNDPKREKKIYLTKEQWKDLLLEITDGDETNNKEFRELYVFDEMIFTRYWYFSKYWPNETDGDNWIIFSDYMPTYGQPIGENYKGVDLVVQGLSEQDIDDFNSIIYPLLETPKQAEIIIPVVANAEGAYGSYWKSDLWIFNPYDEELRGEIFFKPSAQSTPDEEGLEFVLGAKQVMQYTNFLEILGARGTGATKIKMQGEKAPKVKVSTYNQQGEKQLVQGMNGFSLEELLIAGEKAHLISVKDNSRYRFNIGVYAEKESEITFKVYDSLANEIHETTKQFPEKYHIQQNANSFLGTELPENSRITARVNYGMAKIYGSGVQNKSGDGYYQDAIVLSRETTTQEDSTRNIVYAHDKIFNEKPFWQIIYDNAYKLAEILSRENTLTYSTGSPPQHRDIDWWYPVLQNLYDNDPPEVIFEAEFLLIDSKNKRILFTDIYLGGDSGRDKYCINLTERDIADFKALLKELLEK